MIDTCSGTVKPIRQLNKPTMQNSEGRRIENALQNRNIIMLYAKLFVLQEIGKAGVSGSITVENIPY